MPRIYGTRNADKKRVYSDDSGKTWNDVTPFSQVAGSAPVQAVNKTPGLLNVAGDIAYRFPNQGILNTLGAPQRMLSGVISGPKGQGGNLIDRMGSGWYEVLHPNQQAGFTRQLEDTLHVSQFKTPEKQISPAQDFPVNTPFGPVMLNYAALKNAAIDMGVETASDPLSYTGVLGLNKKAGQLLAKKLTQAIGQLFKDDMPAAVRTVARWFHPTPDLANVDDATKAFVKTTQTKIGQYIKDIHHDDLTIAQRNKSAMDQGAIPQEVRDSYLRRLWIEGSPQARKDAVAMGYKPTQTEQSLFPHPLNLVGRGKKDYIYGVLEAQAKREHTPLLPGQTVGARVKSAPFAGPQRNKPTGDFYQRFVSRMNASTQQLLDFGHASRAQVIGKLGERPPDITQLNRELQSAKNTGVKSRIDAAQQKLDAANAHLEQLAKDPELIRLDQLLKAQKNPGALPKAGGFMPSLFPQAEKNLGVTAGKLGAPTEYAKELPTKTLEARLKRLESEYRDITYQDIPDRPRLEILAKQRLAAEEEFNRRLKHNAQLQATKMEAGRLYKEQVLGQYVPKGPGRHVTAKKEHVGGLAPLRFISDLYRAMLFTMPGVHGPKNIPTLLTGSPLGGVAAEKAAMQGAAKALPGIVKNAPSDILGKVGKQELIVPKLTPEQKRLRYELGGHTEYGKPFGTEKGWGATPIDTMKLSGTAKLMGNFVNTIGKVNEATNKLAEGLNRLARPATRMTEAMDESMRLKLMDKLDSDPATKHLSNDVKGELVRFYAFDYEHQSGFVKWLRSMGAPFPQWKVGLLPRLLAFAVQYPEKYVALSRAFVDYNRQNHYAQIARGKKPYDLDLNLPTEDLVRFLVAPRTYGATTMGPGFSWLADRGGEYETPTLTAAAGKLAGNVGIAQPFLKAAGASPFYSPATPSEQAMAAVFGGRQQGLPSPHQQRVWQLIMQGMSKKDAEFQVQREDQQIFNQQRRKRTLLIRSAR